MAVTRRLSFLTVLLAPLVTAVPACAQSGALEVPIKSAAKANAPEAGKVKLYTRSKALVIGIDAYTEKGWPKLSNAYNDAKAVADALQAQGFEVTVKRDLKADDLDRTLKNFFVFEGGDPNTRLFLWFAGHGHTVDGEGYLVPADAVGPDNDTVFRSKAISMRRFGEYMREAKAMHVLAMFDSCFSGSVFNVARATPPPAITLATTQPTRQFVSSGEAEQLVSDDGTFRKLFLDALAGKEPAADANGDGYITGSELGLFLHDKLTNLTRNRQTPRYGKLNALGFDRGDFVFEAGRLAPPSAAVQLPPSAKAEAERERLARQQQEEMPKAGAAKAEAKHQSNEAAAEAARTTLTQKLQTELKRVGCYTGTVDGRWGGNTRFALAQFSKQTKITLVNEQPTETALQALVGRKAPVCGLNCGSAQQEVNGRCVARPTVIPQRPPETAPAKPPSQSAPGQGGNCPNVIYYGDSCVDAAGRKCWRGPGQGPPAIAKMVCS